MTDIVTAIAWLAGSAFALLAAVGVLRMPDVFTRMQASTKASTLGLGCLLIGAALQLGDFASLIRVASIGAFVLLTTPVSGLVIARAAYFADVPLWEGTVLDERKRDR
jgi:multicomponent Na+:H+ antiporter subunit G